MQKLHQKHARKCNLRLAVPLTLNPGSKFQQTSPFCCVLKRAIIIIMILIIM